MSIKNTAESANFDCLDAGFMQIVKIVRNK